MAAPVARRRAFPRSGVAAALAVCWLAAPVALAQTTTTARQLFERARAAEQQLESPASVDTLRRVARDYETVVLRFPTSGYCDDALWQAATLLEQAWNRAADTRDRDAAIKAYDWLAREYPVSRLRSQAQARAAALTQAAAPRQTPAAADAAAQAGPVQLQSITRSELPRGDRLTIEFNAETPYLRDRIDNPDRVFFDFADVTAAAAVAAEIRDLKSPLINAVRIGSPTHGVTRVVIELAGSPRYSAYALYAPFRVVVDLETTAPPLSPAASPAATPSLPPPPAIPPTSAPATAKPTPSPTPVEASPAPPSSTTRGDYSLARQLGLRVSKVVIDPGHGGHDPGAISNGVTEAELVLDVALRLEKLLESLPGVEVVLTRRTNEFVPLEERTAIANRERADLFLSIHANSHRQPAVRGIETYFLNFATNPDAEAVAARENAASVQTMNAIPAILKAIAMNNKIEESREFAAVLQAALVRKVQTPAGGAKDLGVKQAPFVVLIGAEMPSVLTEIGFLTNKTEAAALKKPAQRQTVAQALRDAVVRYQDSLKRVSTATGPVAR